MILEEYKFNFESELILDIPTKSKITKLSKVLSFPRFRNFKFYEWRVNGGFDY